MQPSPLSGPGTGTKHVAGFNHFILFDYFLYLWLKMFLK